MNARVSDFEKLNAKYGNDMELLFGPTSLGFPEDVDSNRLYMLSSNLKQILTQQNPDVPHVLTGSENIFGRLSDGYKQLEGSWEVVDKISKFGDNSMYMLVLYNAETNEYDMIEKKVAENLTEKFGIVYDTKVMDNMEVGKSYDEPIIYKSTSYDDNMNYRLGKNALVMYTNSTANIEDAIKIRRGFAESIKVFEVDSVMVPINDNDILLFMHGNEKDGYRTIPNIGEKITNSTLCATRRVNKNHLLYDFQAKNLRELSATDTEFVCPKNSQIYDINIYYNNTDKPFPDNVFYKQLKFYYDMNCQYAAKIVEWAERIKNGEAKPGAKCTFRLNAFHSKYMRFNDPEYKWKNKDRAFNNLMVEFKIVTVASLSEGYKLVGRYGDKGVISKICNNAEYMKEHDDSSESYKNFTATLSSVLGINLPDNAPIEIVDDESMMYTKGEYNFTVDLELNASGAIRRINCGQLYEVEINFCNERMRQHLCKMTDMREKVNLVSEYLSILNMDAQIPCIYNGSKGTPFTKLTESDIVTLPEIYEKDPEFIERLIKSIEVNGFYIIKSPDSNIRYKVMKLIYEKYEDIMQPYDLYIDIFGMKGKKVMRKGIIGSKYMYVLKQTSRKNFSARSTGRITKANLPAKSTDKKDNLIIASNSPIQIGETHNMHSQISGATMAMYNLFTRTSPKARKSLKKMLSAPGNPMEIRKLKVDETYVNANVQILQARLKTMGIKYTQVTNKSITKDRLQHMKGFIDAFGLTFFDYIGNREFYVFIIDKYNRVVRSGKERSSEEAWKTVVESEEYKLVNPPDAILEAIKPAIYAREVALGQIVIEEPVEVSDDPMEAPVLEV